jgi:transposase-like protein
MPFTYGPETKERALALYREVPCTYEVARRLGCSQTSVWRWAKAAGALRPYVSRGRPRTAYDPAVVARAVARCVAGEPPSRVAVEIGVCARTLARWIDEAGATLPAPRRLADSPFWDLLLSWEQIMAPGPGAWDAERLIQISEARNAAIAANPSGFDRPPVLA